MKVQEAHPRPAFRWTVIVVLLLTSLALGSNPAASQDVIDRGNGHRIRPVIGTGTAGYNLGVEGEYSLLPYVSVVGTLHGWIGDEQVRCVQVTGGGTCPLADQGWGTDIGVRLAAVDRHSWWLFLQGSVGAYSFSSVRTGVAPSLGAKLGVVARFFPWLELETAVRYQYVTAQEGESVTYGAEHWGALVVGFGMPIG